MYGEDETQAHRRFISAAVIFLHDKNAAKTLEARMTWRKKVSPTTLTVLKAVFSFCLMRRPFHAALELARISASVSSGCKGRTDGRKDDVRKLTCLLEGRVYEVEQVPAVV